MSDNQTVINRMSLVMTIPEDLVRACRENSFSPNFVESILRLHNQQIQIENALNEIRKTQFQIAQVIDKLVLHSSAMTENITEINKTIGYSDEELTGPDEFNG